jgi:hypothetical protein
LALSGDRAVTEPLNVEQTILILTAKAAMLERLVRQVLLDLIAEHNDPSAVVKAMAENLITSTEAQIKGGSHSTQALLLVENFQAFFDQLTHEVSQLRPPPG